MVEGKNVGGLGGDSCVEAFEVFFNVDERDYDDLLGAAQLIHY